MNTYEQPTFYRAVTTQGITVITRDPEAEPYMWVDSDPLDLQPAQYSDTRIVELGDRCVAGGEEFTVDRVEPAYGCYSHGRVHGGSTWYAAQHVTLLERKNA